MARGLGEGGAERAHGFAGGLDVGGGVLGRVGHHLEGLGLGEALLAPRDARLVGREHVLLAAHVRHHPEQSNNSNYLAHTAHTPHWEHTHLL
jgi:hypothetical protein